MDKQTLYRYGISTLITFMTGFLIAFYPIVEQATTWGDVAWPSVILGAAFAGFRLVVKGLVELVAHYSTKK